MKVWTLVTHYHHDGEVFVSVHSTRKHATGRLLDFVVDNWDNEVLGHDLIDLGEQEAVNMFFESLCDDFSYNLEEKDLQGKLRIEEMEEPGEVFLTEGELLIASIGLQHVDVEKMSLEIGEAPNIVEDKVIEVAKKLG